MPIKKKRRTRRPISRKTYFVFFLIFTAILVISHGAFLTLPFYWDEAGQFVPAALDLYHSGALIPRSVAPNAHPPGLMAYLAAVWTVTGYSILATRIAMLLLAGLDGAGCLSIGDQALRGDQGDACFCRGLAASGVAAVLFAIDAGAARHAGDAADHSRAAAISGRQA